MDDEPSTSQLRNVIAEGVHALLRDGQGISQAAIARAAGVDPATVTRWKQRTSTASYEASMRLAEHWPHHFDRDLIDALNGVPGVPFEPASLARLEGAAAVYTAVAEAIQSDDHRDREILHVALHLDAGGRGDTIANDPAIDDDEREAMRAFTDALAVRAGENWLYECVFAAATPERGAVVIERARSLPGREVRIRGTVAAPPLVPNLMVVGGRQVFLAVDHPRFEKPSSAVVIRSRTAVEWARTYFAGLARLTPFVLRDERGVDESAIGSFEATLRNREAAPAGAVDLMGVPTLRDPGRTA